MDFFVTILAPITVFVLISCNCPISSGFILWNNINEKTSDCTGRDGNPYFFGTTDLMCGKGTGKRAASRGIWDISHRWIYYQGYYFERLVAKDVYNTSVTDADTCDHKMESTPAGYSKLSLSCIKKCTDNYREKYGGYDLLTNNCHLFANRLSKILCDSTVCPSWCK